MGESDRKLLGVMLATGVMVLMISFAVGDDASFFQFLTLVSISASVAFFFTVFPGSRFFVISLANFLAVYFCIFVVFVEASFTAVAKTLARTSYILPILGFMLGTFLRREAIRDTVVSHRVQEGSKFRRGLPWVLPVLLVGISTFAIPVQALSAIQILLGILLLLFGFSEIMSYTKERGAERQD